MFAKPIALLAGCLLTLTLLHPSAFAQVAQDDADSPPSQAPASDSEEFLALYGMLAEAVAQVELNYAQPVDRRQLFESALRGMLRDLDPYSAYLSPEQFESYQKRIQGERPSFGLELALREGRLTILTVEPGSPAASQNLQPGEFIVTIDGAETPGVSLNSVEQKLAAAGGGPVTLGIEDASGETRELTLQGAMGSKQTVIGAQRNAEGGWRYIVREDPRIAQIVVLSFTKNTASDLRTLLSELKQQDLQAVLLDLRFNAGGLLSASIDVADLFLEEGLIVSTEGRNAKRRQWRASASDDDCKLPLALLVNRYSASGAEVVAAALQDHGRATIVGERTWGKGSVQNLFELEHGGSGLKLTTASYHRPSGANIHRFRGASTSDEWGVSPEPRWALAVPAEQAQALINHRSRLIAPPKDNPPVSPLVDRQLDLAVEALLDAIRQQASSPSE